MHIVFVDNSDWRRNLLPLTFIRPASALRIGILTIEEKWSRRLGCSHSYLTEEYLGEKYPFDPISGNEFLLIRGNICPNDRLLESADQLKSGEALTDAMGMMLLKTDRTGLEDYRNRGLVPFHSIPCQYPYLQIVYPEDLFLNNGREIQSDFELVTKDRVSARLSSTNQLLGEQIFAEEGAGVECSVLNSLKGPIYLGKNSEVWENCAIRGAFALCEGSQVKMGTRIYSNVTIGPESRIGGELNTCVILGYSSKGHDGYLGSAVMGEWCNWGADTNNSNLKNNYKNVNVYNYLSDSYRDTGLQFYGLIMGDHSKCSINTAFNTGTVVGVGASIFGSGFPPTFIPDFSWGGSAGFEEYNLERMFETASLVYERRNRIFDEKEQAILKRVFEVTRNKRTT